MKPIGQGNPRPLSDPGRPEVLSDITFTLHIIIVCFGTRFAGYGRVTVAFQTSDCETTGGPMSYDKVQAVREFGRWSHGYDRCILQRLLFGPSHRAIIARVRARSGERPLTILDVGCGTGVFVSRIMAASPRSTVWGIDLVSAMLAQGQALASAPGTRRRGPGGQRAPPLPGRHLRHGDVCQQLPPLSAPGPCHRRDVPCPQARWAVVPGQRLSRWPLGMVHLRRLRRRRGGGRPARLGPQGLRPVRPGRVRRDEPGSLSRPGPFPPDRGSDPHA